MSMSFGETHGISSKRSIPRREDNAHSVFGGCALCSDVRVEQEAQCRAALSARSPLRVPEVDAAAASPSAASSPLYRWNLIADPGIGFAKTPAHSVGHGSQALQECGRRVWRDAVLILLFLSLALVSGALF